MADQVNHPPHYQCGGIETIDVIRAKLGPGFGYYCEGNAIKYLTRWRLKGGVEDLRKARVYLDWLIESEAFDPCTGQSPTPNASYEEQAVAHHALDEIAAQAQAMGLYGDQHHAVEAPMGPPIMVAVFGDPERDDDEGTQGEPPRGAA
jgi:hypothetical protein